MINKETIRAYRLTTAAVEVLEAAGRKDIDVDADYISIDDNGAAALFGNCVEGAEEGSVAGWREYVDCLVAAKPRSPSPAQERRIINNWLANAKARAALDANDNVIEQARRT